MPEPGPLRPLCPGSMTTVAPGGSAKAPGRAVAAGADVTGGATGGAAAGLDGGPGAGAAAGALPGPAQLQSSATRTATRTVRGGRGRVGTREMATGRGPSCGDPAPTPCRGTHVRDVDAPVHDPHAEAR